MRRIGSGGGGYDYVQAAEPTDPELGETWFDTDAPDGGSAFVFTDSGFVELSITQHGDLQGVSEGQHRSNTRVETLSGNVVEDHRANETHDTAQPPQSHALGGGIHSAATRAELNALVSDATLESEAGAQSKANSAEASAESYADSEIENHRTGETHATAQPPQSHNNAAHTESYTTTAEAAAAAPVDSVNGETGAVTVDAGSLDQTDWSDESANRSLDTTYTNQTGNPLWVSVTVRNEQTDPAPNVRLEVDGFVSAHQNNIKLTSGTVATFSKFPVTGLIPPGSTYRVVAFIDGAVLQGWFESELFVS